MKPGKRARAFVTSLRNRLVDVAQLEAELAREFADANAEGLEHAANELERWVVEDMDRLDDPYVQTKAHAREEAARVFREAAIERRWRHR